MFIDQFINIPSIKLECFQFWLAIRNQISLLAVIKGHHFNPIFSTLQCISGINIILAYRLTAGVLMNTHR